MLLAHYELAGTVGLRVTLNVTILTFFYLILTCCMVVEFFGAIHR